MHRHAWNAPAGRKAEGTIRTCATCGVQNVKRSGRWERLEPMPDKPWKHSLACDIHPCTCRDEDTCQTKTEAPMESEPTTPEGDEMNENRHDAVPRDYTPGPSSRTPEPTVDELRLRARQAENRRAAVAVYAPNSPELPRLEREAREAEAAHDLAIGRCEHGALAGYCTAKHDSTDA